MNNLTDNPLIVFALALFLLWLSARIGSSFLKRRLHLEEGVRQDFSIILTATLTLLVLIIGFSFFMGINRYDQRKDYEETEANAIGTEYVRADLLPAADAARVRALLRNYLDDRILFYKTRNEQQLRQINANTAQLQSELWAAVKTPAAAQPTCVVALAISGMNDVLNSQASLVEPNPASGLGSDGRDRHLLQLFGWLWCASPRGGRRPDVNSTDCGVHLVLSHRGH